MKKSNSSKTEITVNLSDDRHFSRRQFLSSGVVAATGLLFAQQYLKSAIITTETGIFKPQQDIFQQFQCPQWFRDAKFGLWLHWGPQTIPEKGGGWYARHMYMEPQKLGRETFGEGAWQYHRDTFGHQSEAGYKELCHLWKAEKFDAEVTIKQFKQWGARYIAVMGNHHDNYDLFNSTVHQWNATKVGPKRDIVGEVAAAARRNKLKWAVSIHCFRAKGWFEPAFWADSEGPKKDVLYDGNLTLADGKGKWWEGLDPQQLYAHKYADFEKEAAQRHLELVRNYRPDMIYFDEGKIQPPMVAACEELYRNSLAQNGSIQTIVTVKSPAPGTVLDYERGVAEGMRDEYWQTDTTLDEHWFLKPNPDGSTRLIHNARSLKELLVDIVSKRGILLLNIAVRADGSIPSDQFTVMEEFGSWLKSNGEAIYETQPWKVYGEGGDASGGHFSERGVTSEPWDHHILRYTCNKAQTILYIHVFGNSAGKDVVAGSLAKDKGFISGKIKKLSLIGNKTTVKWSLQNDGLHFTMPDKVAFKDCNVIKMQTICLL